MGNLGAPPYDAKAVANYFILLAKRDGKELDPMKIQKLAYLAHGWSLALLGKPLIIDKVEAWKYGPVIRSIYRAFADVGNGNITHPAFDVIRLRNGKLGFQAPQLGELSEPENKSVRELLEEVWKAYSGFTAIQLSNYTHKPDSPWAQTYKPGIEGLVIDDEMIKRYFSSLPEIK